MIFAKDMVFAKDQAKDYDDVDLQQHKPTI